jgi:flagellar biosynthesis GTPase FlhF
MKSKLVHSFIVSLIIIFSHQTSVTAVTDAELEALEKQLEQQETEEKKQTEAEAKRKAEQKRKAEAEAEKKRLVELEKQRMEEEQRQLENEKRKFEEEKKKLEESRLAELERKRQEEEKIEKYNLLISEAEQAIEDKDKELAISKYTETLALVPGDSAAKTGIQQAEKLLDKFCYKIVGTWKSPGWGVSPPTIFYENGTVQFNTTLVTFTNKWACHPERKQISMDILNNVRNAEIYDFRLSDDDRELYFVKYGGRAHLEKINNEQN